MEADTIMCRQMNRCGSAGRCARQTRQESGGDFGCGCSCGCDNTQTTSPTATISMADYESFILVPTSVFDQGDVGCGCGSAW